MHEESFFVDIDCYQQKKHGQNTFGDCFSSKRFTDEGRVLAVLSDGLGSGIKANILATMTATTVNDLLHTSKFEHRENLQKLIKGAGPILKRMNELIAPDIIIVRSAPIIILFFVLIFPIIF